MISQCSSAESLLAGQQRVDRQVLCVTASTGKARRASSARQGHREPERSKGTNGREESGLGEELGTGQDTAAAKRS